MKEINCKQCIGSPRVRQGMLPLYARTNACGRQVADCKLALFCWLPIGSGGGLIRIQGNDRGAQGDDVEQRHTIIRITLNIDITAADSGDVLASFPSS